MNIHIHNSYRPRILSLEEMTKLLDHDPKTLVRVSHNIGEGEVDCFESATKIAQIPPHLRSPQSAAHNFFNTKVTKDESFLSQVETLLKMSGISQRTKRPEAPPSFFIEGILKADAYCIAMTSAGIGNGKFRVRKVLRQLNMLEKKMAKNGYKPHEFVPQLKKSFKELPQPFAVTDLVRSAKDGLKTLIRKA